MTYAPIVSASIDIIATTTLTLSTRGEGFIDFTRDVRQFLEETGGVSGTVNLFIRHTSASLTIQENADPDVLTDLTTALRRMAPDNAGWIHATEGPDDMPAHIKTMLTSCSLQIPVIDGAMALGTWQGIYLIEHRTRPHRREIVMQFIGTRDRA
ncbi:secondary thiamine-phosphate synthase enzyme YjbQ [Bradyrhizobium sp. SYSU BS000235]|uniref:secondary thiamine-phosphate synthase enzyme YjbQ n=1 Tax=Bradyrhizobium sp. SYSU BS000235 TaxID=3411332 RepID=UPI003C730920